MCFSVPVCVRLNVRVPAHESMSPSLPAGPDLHDSSFLKLKADKIAEPRSYIFNLILERKRNPKDMEDGIRSPIVKGGDPTLK